MKYEERNQNSLLTQPRSGICRESRNKFRSKKRKNLSMINGSSIYSTDLNVYKQTGNKFILTPQKSAVCHNQVSVIYHLLSLFLNYSKIHEEGSKRFREFKMDYDRCTWLCNNAFSVKVFRFIHPRVFNSNLMAV